MALHIKALNNDTSFLLTFIPSICPADQKFPETFPGACTVLLDPLAPLETDGFNRKSSSCISSLNDIEEPDVILISQAQPEHCHEESLCQLSPHIQSMIVGEPNAIKKIKRWRHFDLGSMSALRRYKRGRSDTMFRMEIPPPSSLGMPGEITIALLAPKVGTSGGVHNAIGITYREPSSILSQSRATIRSPTESRASSAKPTSSIGSTAASMTAYAGCEPTVSVLYTPHGVSFDVIEPWVSTHLGPGSGLPPVAMIHCTTVVDAPWYAGGNQSTGCPGGLELAQRLLPTAWIAAHDENELLPGGPVKNTVRKEHNIVDAQKQLWNRLGEKRIRRRPQIMRLEGGETVRIDQISANMVVKATTQKIRKEEEITKPDNPEPAATASSTPEGTTEKPA